jgi:PAS domain S-box-containing protein
VRLRQIAPVALVLAVAIAGFVVARLLADRDELRDSERRAEVAATQIHGRVEQAASLTESLRRFMLDAGATGVTSDEFARNASRWLSPSDFPAAAWVEPVPAPDRPAYQRRIGQPIVTPDERHSVVPAGSRASYLPATLVSGFPPLALPGIDLGGEPGMGAALDRARGLGPVIATPVAGQDTGMSGLFLLAPAPNLVGDRLRPGYVLVFAPETTLRAGTASPGLLLAVGGTMSGGQPSGRTVRRSFSEAGQRFDVILPRGSVSGAGAALPWIVLASGLVLAALAAALGINAARRARAQDELDRIFTLSPDLIAVADLDVRFTRLNPAAEQILGRSKQELLERPYLEFVHPDDRATTAAQGAALAEGSTTQSFENRFIRADGSARVLEWTAAAVADEGVMYGVARDVTERRRAERELERLAGEQSALRRVATLVATGVPPAEVFSAVAHEVERLLGSEATVIGRLETGPTVVIVASAGLAPGSAPVGTRLPLDQATSIGTVLMTGRPVRVDDVGTTAPPSRAARLGIRSAVAVPIMVEGALWGVIGIGTSRERFAADAEERLAKFTELVATAIGNAETRSQLTASRRRIVAASDDARRRIERNLHDGAQQRLAALRFSLQATEAAVPADRNDLRAELSGIATGLRDALTDLQDLSRGVHPAVLSKGGLGPALRTLARRSAVPVHLDVGTDSRYPESIEVAAYYAASEAAANATKHAQASRMDIAMTTADGNLLLSIRDDGVGGADPERGSGLIGLRDRVEALGGRLRIDSPSGGGTSLALTLPLDGDAATGGDDARR